MNTTVNTNTYEKKNDNTSGSDNKSQKNEGSGLDSDDVA